MPLYDEPKNSELHQLVCDAVLAANEVVSRLEGDRRYIGTHFDFPTKATTNEHGWPSITSPFGGGPTDYGAAFGLKAGNHTPVAFSDVREIAACIDYVVSDEELRHRANEGYEPISGDDRFATIGASFIITEILDRARHEAGPSLPEELIDRLYLEIEPTWVLDRLPIEILIPILLTKFEIDTRLEVVEGVSIEKMDDGTNRARAYTKHHYSDANPFLLQAATRSRLRRLHDPGGRAHGAPTVVLACREDRQVLPGLRDCRGRTNRLRPSHLPAPRMGSRMEG